MDLEQTAIARLRTAAHMSEKVYHKPLLVTTSGGKDSSVCVALAERAGIEFDVMHNHTTADAPETVYFIRNELRRLEAKGIKCMISYPTYKGIPTTMWKLIPMKLMPPTRLVRYCCAVFKEQGGKDRFITTGVRWAESNSRKNNRGIYESVPSDAKKKIILNNDNDDTRQLFEGRSVKACQPALFLWVLPRGVRWLSHGLQSPLEGVRPLPQVSAHVRPGLRRDDSRAHAPGAVPRMENRRGCLSLVDGGRGAARTNRHGRVDAGERHAR